MTTGAEGMVGEKGEAITRCTPRGRVRVRGEIWNARCAEGAEEGAQIVVAAVEGLTLVVRTI